ncbi:TPA: hypothetical protein N0F65_008219 [Lagenidium giganteum]|uniref:Membrane transporter protein n=1 Tax=Lagenidium giganteum TaxID=4803 RepID=A0AAV2Z139_9STRA|nr:TPA: hypothetical protein N0F65_008219 [Lagenidium giganteum]
MCLASLIIFIAAGGGTGGGGALDPIYILIMGLDAKEAIPLSSATIVGGAMSNFILNVRKGRVGTSTPLIDWDLLLIMQPMLLIGAIIGTGITNVAPTWLLCMLLVGLLSLTGFRTFQRAIKERRKETWHCCSGQSGESLSLLARERQNTAMTRKCEVPWKKVGTLFGLFCGVAVLSFIAGSHSFPSPLGIQPNTALYSIVSILPSIFLMVFSYYSSQNMVAAYQRQQYPGYIPSHGEIQWTQRSIITFPLFSMLAGMVSGMFGIGGGIINAPLLLEMGIDPTATSAITATTVLFSSAMSSCSYLLLGTLNLHFAQIMLPMGFITTWVGHVCLTKIVRHYNCPSLIIFSMAIVVSVSAVAMSVESIKALLN